MARPPRAPGQRAFPFLGPDPDYSADRVIVGEANREAAAAACSGERPDRRALVFAGPPESGKSHLLSVWCERAGADAIVLDDAHDPRDPAELLTRLKGAEAGRPVALAGRGEPSDWSGGVRDLATRLASARIVRIAEPDEALARAYLRRRLEDRGLSIGGPALSFVAARSPRTYAALARFAARADALALERGVSAVGLDLAGAALDDAAPDH